MIVVPAGVYLQLLHLSVPVGIAGYLAEKPTTMEAIAVGHGGGYILAFAVVAFE